MDAYYYLHTETKDLIHKKFPVDPSNFTQRIWSIDTTNRLDAWGLLLEALALGASTKRIRTLAEYWRCDGRDLVEYITRHLKPSELQRKGLSLFIEKIIGVEPDAWLDWLAATPKGGMPDFDTMPSCERCHGTGAVDTPFSGFDPVCPDCDGEGT